MLGFSRWQLFKVLVFAAGTFGVISLALTYFIPAPPSTVGMAIAFRGGFLEYYGRQYREIFARSNIELELHETNGVLESLEVLEDPKSGVQIAAVVGGVSDGKHVPEVLSLGTISNSPFWLFYSSSEPIDRLSQLKGKRIAAGPAGSGTRSSAEKILGKGGVNSENAVFLPLAASAAAEALRDGKVDAVWAIGAPDGAAIHAMLEDPGVRLMSFPTAEAFTIIFPEFVRLVLPRGVVDIDRNIPPTDVPLLGTTSKVLVRSDLHPEIVQLLLQAMVKVHGTRAVFQQSNEFPNSTDTEFPVAPAAIDFYKNGPSFMQRHLPLWLSVHAQRAIAVLVAAIAIGFPLVRLLPLAYNWIARRRLFYWYAKLKALEASFDADPKDMHLAESRAEIERIEHAVSHISIPLTFSDQVYNLRSHIDIVRRKIASRNNATERIAAE
jgi:TRAP-type uncharacterized transport system substrate-binding protein